MPDEEVYDTCAVCGEEILVSEGHYEMPDGDIVCENCLYEWAEQYKKPGVLWTIP